jgi:hypothetical protein
VLGDRLPGAAEKLPAVTLLPLAGLVSPVALSYATKDGLGVPGLAPLAIGYYKDGPVRFRQAALVAEGADAAKVAMKALRKVPGSLPVPGIGDEATHVVLTSGKTKLEYVFARKDSRVFGVGEEEYGEGATAAGRLPKEQKLARLKAWVEGAAAPSGSAAPPPSAAPKR